MLKPVVEDVDGRAEPVFRHHARHVPIGAHDDHDAFLLKRAGEHERLVAGVVDAGKHSRAVRHNRRAGTGMPSPISSRENRRPLPRRRQQPRDVLDERRLAAAADGKIAHADDRPREPAPTIGMTRIPAAPTGGRRTVNRAQCTNQCTSRNGLTTPPEPAGGSRSASTASVLSFAPRLASTSARAAAPRRARCTGSRTIDRIAASSSRSLSTWIAASLFTNVSAISRKFRMYGPKTIGLPKIAGSRMLWPPWSTRLPPTNTAVAS